MKNPLASISLRDTQDPTVLAQRINELPLAGKAWQQIKALYKANEAAPHAELFVALLQKLDLAKCDSSLQQGVSEKTFAYMKRRAIRALKQLAKKDKDKYVIVVLSFLKLQKDIHPQQWITHHLLYGNSRRMRQNRNGRGNFFASADVGNVFRMEEGAPAIWDENIKLVEALLFVDGLDIRVYEFAVKVLLRNKKTLPVFPRNQVLSFYKSNSPWLEWVASQQCMDALEKGVKMDAYVMAYTYLFGSAKHQSDFGKYLTIQKEAPKAPSRFGNLLNKVFGNEASKGSNLKEEFINYLATIIFSQVADFQMGRRGNVVVEKLTKERKFIKASVIGKYLHNLFAGKDQRFEDLGFYFANHLNVGQVKTLLRQIKHIQPANKFRLFELLLNKNRSKLDGKTFLQEAMESEHFYLSDFAWYVMSKSSSGRTKLVEQFYRGRIYLGWRNVAFRHAIQSQYSAELLAPVMKQHDYYLNYNSKLVIKIYQHGFAAVRDLAKAKILKQARYQYINFLFLLRGLEDREELYNNILAKVDSRYVQVNNLFRALIAKDQWVQSWAWKILVRNGVKEETIRSLTQLIVFHHQPDAVQPLIQELLNHSDPNVRQYFIQGIEFMLSQNTWWVNRVVPVIQKHIDHFEPQSIINIISTVDDNGWTKLQPVVNEYAATEKGAAFWLRVLEVIPESESTILADRVFNDEKLRVQLLQIEDPAILNIKHPIYAELLSEWLQQHVHVMEAEESLWLKTATHKLLAVRSWTIQNMPKAIQIQPFMLQLLESDIPDAVAFAKRYFEAKISSRQMSLDHILALCDSPREQVRLYGMQLFEKEKQQLDSVAALECLAEHIDPRVQHFVAKEIAKQNINSTFVKSFDRSVLRSKRRSRSAKELVKKRIETNLQVDVSTLLEMARGTNKQDAEWAVQQLVKLEIAGISSPQLQLGD